MKLYKEEEVIEIANMVDGYRTDELMASLTPIELPTDEEVEEYAKKNAFNYYEFITGAKWIRNKIKGGNK